MRDDTFAWIADNIIHKFGVVLQKRLDGAVRVGWKAEWPTYKAL